MPTRGARGQRAAAQPGHRAIVARVRQPTCCAPTASSIAPGCASARSPTPPFARALEALLHPLIARAPRRAQIAAWTGPYGIARRAAAARARRACGSVVDRVLVVDCPEDEQVRRVMARSGLRRGRGARDHGHAAVARRAPRARPTTCSTTAAPSDALDAAGRARSTHATDGSPPRRRRLDRPGAPPRTFAQNDGCHVRPRTVIRYEHPLNERIRTLMRLEDLFARARFFAGAARRPRASRRAARAVRDHRRRGARRSQDRPPAGARAAEAAARRRCAAIPQIEQRRARGAARRDRRRRARACSRRPARSARTCATTNG